MSRATGASGSWRRKSLGKIAHDEIVILSSLKFVSELSLTVFVFSHCAVLWFTWRSITVNVPRARTNVSMTLKRLHPS